MLKIRFHKNFERQFQKLKAREKQKTRERLQLFLDEPFSPILRNHPLKGRYADYRSINITGDLRAIYKFLSESECIFVAADSHSNLYL